VLVPALIDRVKPPLEFRRRQTADLVAWGGHPGHEGFKALCGGIAAKVKPIEGVAARPPEVIPVRKSRPGLRWKWAAVPAIPIVISVAAYWGLLPREDHTPPVDNLADRVAGIYHGDMEGLNRIEPTFLWESHRGGTAKRSRLKALPQKQGLFDDKVALSLP
jgi:hypothetical protein